MLFKTYSHTHSHYYLWNISPFLKTNYTTTLLPSLPFLLPKDSQNKPRVHLKI